MSNKKADRVASIRARADAATAGPWEVRDCSPAHPELSALFADESVHGSNFDMLTNWSPGFATNAAFIAAARTDIPFLLDQLAAAEAKIVQGPHDYHCNASHGIDAPCDCWKSASPVSALDAVRADARAGALEEAFEIMRPLVGYRNAIELKQLAAEIRAGNPYRAAQTGATE